MLLSIEYRDNNRQFKVVADRMAVSVDDSDAAFKAINEIVSNLLQGDVATVEAYVEVDGERLALPRRNEDATQPERRHR